MCLVKTKAMQKVKLNVGGTVFISYEHTLKTYQNSLLANIDEKCKYYDKENKEYFFDRSPRMFDFILDAYRTGFIHLPKDICGTIFRTELEFWGLSPTFVSPCCWSLLYGSQNHLQTVKTLERCFNHDLPDKSCTAWRERIWRLLREPNSSIYAKFWAVFITLVTVASFGMTAVGTVQSLRSNSYNQEIQTDVSKIADQLGWSNTSSYLSILVTKPNCVIQALDAGCFCLLTAEWIVCWVVSTRRIQLLRTWAFFAEISACLAYWVSFVLDANGAWARNAVCLLIYVISKYAQLLRLVRLYRVGKHFPALRVLGLTFTSSRQEMYVLTLMLFILTTLFGTSLFFVEAVSNNKLENIFSAMYWALITLTTVGFGDYVPATPAGRVIACACAVCGILMLVMPVGIITTSFHNLYEQQKYVQCFIEDNKSLAGDKEQKCLNSKHALSI